MVKPQDILFKSKPIGVYQMSDFCRQLYHGEKVVDFIHNPLQHNAHVKAWRWYKFKSVRSNSPQGKWWKE